MFHHLFTAFFVSLFDKPYSSLCASSHAHQSQKVLSSLCKVPSFEFSLMNFLCNCCSEYHSTTFCFVTQTSAATIPFSAPATFRLCKVPSFEFSLMNFLCNCCSEYHSTTFCFVTQTSAATIPFSAPATFQVSLSVSE